MRAYAILVCILLCLGMCEAQVYRQNTYNTNSVFMYFGNHKVTEKLGLYTEVQVRRNDFVKNWQQLLLRTGIDFYRPQARFTIGYGYVKTYPYGEFPAANAFPEHRIWQQVLLSQMCGRIKISHRYRLEQRLIGNAAVGKFSNARYENRFRYMWRANIPLQGNTIDPNEFYIGLYDEVMFNFGKEVKYNLFDQNRLYGAIGYHLGKSGKLEVGYMHHILQHRGLYTSGDPMRNIIENNKTFQIGFFSDLNLFKQKEK